ncbi:hypothetical protein DY000_02059288 [Brassica cretica]|uniref:Uncharacterized protein n=1 Tax=Brassica cretica TaxID=69181 RepID=A0ABQ7ASH8_BRACR|nr:hypothetical protein DY000_02059288 [Brassica cretica]
MTNKVGSGGRSVPSPEAVFFQIKSTGPCLLLVASGFRLSELWSASNRRGSVPGVTTRLREGCAVKTLVVRVLSPGDGGSHRSVAAGLLAPSRGSFFSSAVVGSSLRGSWFGCLCSRRRRVNVSGGKGDDACDAFSWVFAVNSGG